MQVRKEHCSDTIDDLYIVSHPTVSSPIEFLPCVLKPITRSRDTSCSSQEKRLGEARSLELSQRTQTFVLRRSNDILLQYLPEKIEQILFIPLTPMQANIYRALLRGKAIRQVLATTHGSGNDALG